MKPLMRVALIAAIFIGSACRVGSYATGTASTDFYGELSPYGSWVTLSPYGAVWQPSAAIVGADFYPYSSGGSWVSSSYGWSWQSQWSWGWIPFHHGRWFSSDPYGWVWLPGDEWAPAWVEWRVGGGNIGWVPLGPAGVFGNYRPRWCFVPVGYFGSPGFQRYRLPAYREYGAYHSATAIPFERGDSRRGPSPELVRRAGGEVRTLPPAPPRMLRPGDVRAERRVGRAASPLPGRPEQPVPRIGREPMQREPSMMRPPPPAAPMPSMPSRPSMRGMPQPPAAPAPIPPMPSRPSMRGMPPPPGAPAPMMRPSRPRPAPQSAPPPARGGARGRQTQPTPRR